jgi:hypothetical protein
MQREHSNQSKEKRTSPGWYKLGLWGAISIIGYFLITEHQAHIVQFLPYLLLLACPLMHIFMHSEHESHSDDSYDPEGREHKNKLEGQN